MNHHIVSDPHPELKDNERGQSPNGIPTDLEVVVDGTEVATIAVQCLLNDSICVEMEHMDEATLCGLSGDLYCILPKSSPKVSSS